jgi:hypothetical protein
LLELIREGEDHRFEESSDELLKKLKKIKEMVNLLDKDIKAIVNKRKITTMANLQQLNEGMNEMTVIIPSRKDLEELLKNAESWIREVREIMLQEEGNWPFIHLIKDLVKTGQELKINFPELNVLCGQVEAAKAWISQLQHTFLKKVTHVTLLEVLSPRIEIPLHPSRPKLDPKFRPTELSNKQYEAILGESMQTLCENAENFRATIKVMLKSC